jgi:hypothetical protein
MNLNVIKPKFLKETIIIDNLDIDKLTINVDRSFLIFHDKKGLNESF